MIQRIQTLYMLAAAILGAVSLARPLGHFHTSGGALQATLFNLRLVTADGQHHFGPWALFALLLLVTALTLLSIFLYRRRALQMRILVLSIILSVGYYAWLVALVLMQCRAGSLTFTPTVAAALPLVCIVLCYLAFRAVLRDELLVRSLDRLR